MTSLDARRAWCEDPRVVSEIGASYVIRYVSLADLAEDEEKIRRFFAVSVVWTGIAPAVGTRTRVKLVVPGDATIELTGLVDRIAQGHGFRVALDPAMRGAARDLFNLVSSPAFGVAQRVESPDVMNSRDVRCDMEPSLAGEFGNAVTNESGEYPSDETTADGESGAANAGDEAAVDEDGDIDDAEIGVQESDRDDAPTDFPVPKGGDEYIVYVLKFRGFHDYVDYAPTFESTATMRIPIANDEAKQNDLAELRLVLPGRNIFSMHAMVARVGADAVEVVVNKDSSTFQKACDFVRTTAAKKRPMAQQPSVVHAPVAIRFLQEKRDTGADNDSLPLRRRLQRMGMDDKINLALSGTREERMALALDGNKAVHHYLLRNARISLDEISFMARLPSMNPDVLRKIGENPQYTQNLTVTKGLVFNPKTPTTLAIRLLSRLPRGEIMQIAKRTTMNARLVQAAKRILEGKS